MFGKQRAVGEEPPCDRGVGMSSLRAEDQGERQRERQESERERDKRERERERERETRERERESLGEVTSVTCLLCLDFENAGKRQGGAPSSACASELSAKISHRKMISKGPQSAPVLHSFGNPSQRALQRTEGFS